MTLEIQSELKPPEVRDKTAHEKKKHMPQERNLGASLKANMPQQQHFGVSPMTKELNKYNIVLQSQN